MRLYFLRVAFFFAVFNKKVLAKQSHSALCILLFTSSHTHFQTIIESRRSENPAISYERTFCIETKVDLEHHSRDSICGRKNGIPATVIYERHSTASTIFQLKYSNSIELSSWFLFSYRIIILLFNFYLVVINSSEFFSNFNCQSMRSFKAYRAISKQIPLYHLQVQ